LRERYNSTFQFSQFPEIICSSQNTLGILHHNNSNVFSVQTA
jgi:hypothetical protein